METLNMDFKQLAEKIGLEENEYIELIELFIDTSAADMTTLENAVEKENADEVEKAAHSLKGASASLGLTDIAEIARLIEENAREKPSQGDILLVAILKDKIKNIEHLFSEWIP
jgi:histidine phosphotransfer protein HptB